MGLFYSIQLAPTVTMLPKINQINPQIVLREYNMF